MHWGDCSEVTLSWNLKLVVLWYVLPVLCGDACLTGISANVQVLKKSSDRLLLVETVMSAGCC